MKPIVATATAVALLLTAPALAATDDTDAAEDTAAEASADTADTDTADTDTADAGTETAAVEASGDPAAGETVFGRQCVTCHVVVNDAGETLAGNRGRQGPNLFGVTGGPVGAVEDFKYGDGMAEAAEAGAVWDEENFVAYVQDPTEWLREASGDDKARSKMSWKVRNEQDAADVFAYLHDIAPHEGE